MSDNRLRCNPPLAVVEVDRIATSIARYNPERPIPPHTNDGVRAQRSLKFQTAAEISAAVGEKIDWIARPWLASASVTEIDGKIKSAGKTTFFSRSSASSTAVSSWVNPRPKAESSIFLNSRELHFGQHLLAQTCWTPPISRCSSITIRWGSRGSGCPRGRRRMQENWRARPCRRHTSAVCPSLR